MTSHFFEFAQLTLSLALPLIKTPQYSIILSTLVCMQWRWRGISCRITKGPFEGMKDGQLEGWIPTKLWESAYYCAPAWLWLIYWDYKLEKHFSVWKVFLMDTLPPDSNFELDSFDDFIIWIVKAIEYVWSLRPVIKILEELEMS